MAATTADTSMWGLYVHKAQDGALTVVDAAGKPVPSPPTVSEGADGNFTVVGSAGQATLPAYSPPIHNVYAYTKSDGTVTVVDASGNPVPTPPDLKPIPGSNPVVVDSSGQVVEDGQGPVEIPPYTPPTQNVFVFGDTVVDASGNPVPSPPLRSGLGGTKSYTTVDANGVEVTLPRFTPPTTGVFAYEKADGSVVVVDAAGKPVFASPSVAAGQDRYYLLDETTAEYLPIPRYAPPTANVYLYEASDGSTTVVDAAGNPVPSPPLLDGKQGVIGHDGKPVLDPSTGSQITLPAYAPPTANVYLYEASDGSTTVVDAAGNPVPSPPDWADYSDITGTDYAGPQQLVLKGPDGKLLLDPDGNPIPLSAYEPTDAPRLLVHVAQDGTPQVVDATGQPVASPPSVGMDPKSGEPVVLDAMGKPLVDENGNSVTLPSFSPPTQGVYAHVMTNPATGEVDVQIVDAAGNLVQSPPGFKLQSSGDPSDPPTVVLLDANGQPITDAGGSSMSAPLYSPPTQGVYAYVGAGGVEIVDAAGVPVPSPPNAEVVVDASGKKVVTLYGLDGDPVEVPLYSPPTQGVYAHVVTHPATGEVDVQIVDAAGNLVQSPPGFKLQSSGDPSDPPTVVLLDAYGQPITDADGSSMSAPLYSPPTQGIYAHVVTHPATGEVDVQIVDAAGNLVQSPPGFKLQSSGDPSDPPTVVLTDATGQAITDQDGNPISVPLDPNSSAPPGAPPPVDEETDTTDTTDKSEGESEDVAEETDPEAKDEPDQAGAVPDATPAGTDEVAAPPEPEAESEAVAGENEELPAADDRYMDAETDSPGRTAEPEIEAELVPEAVEAIDAEPAEEVSPIGLGAEELVEIVAGAVAEGGGAATEDADGQPPGGGEAVEIPDLLVPELDRKGDDRPVPGSGDIEFNVEVAPAEKVVDEEPIAEVVEVDSVTGLGGDELGGVLAGTDAAGAAGGVGEGIVERVEAEGSGLSEEVPELKWGTEVGAKPEATLASEAVAPELEGKAMPDVEPEMVEFKVEVEAVEETRVEVAEAGTLEIVEEAVGGLSRVVDEPTDEPVGRFETEEEPEEEEEVQS